MRRAILLLSAVPLILFAVTFGPVAPSASDDGNVESVRAGAFADNANSGAVSLHTSGPPQLLMFISTGGSYTTSNAVFRFDTSALPDNAVVSSATLSLYHTGTSSNVTGCQCGIGWYTGAWTAAIFAPYTQPQSSAYGPVALSSLPSTAGRWNATLQNVSNISRTGYTQFRLNMWSCPVSLPGQSSTYVFYDSESGTSTRPELTVVYTLGGPQLILTVYQD